MVNKLHCKFLVFPLLGIVNTDSFLAVVPDLPFSKTRTVENLVDIHVLKIFRSQGIDTKSGFYGDIIILSCKKIADGPGNFLDRLERIFSVFALFSILNMKEERKMKRLIF